MKKISGFCAILCLLAPTHALAMDANGLYARVTAGWSISQDQDFETAAGAVDTSLDNGHAMTGAMGYDYGQARAEVELSYRQSDVDNHKIGGTSLTNPGGESSALALMANGYYDFKTVTKVTPYIGAGVGIAKVKADGYDGNGISNIIDDQDTVLAYQFIAGAEYPISANTSVTGEYRYFATDDADVTTNAGGAVNTDINFNSHSVLVGLKHNFDSGL